VTAALKHAATFRSSVDKLGVINAAVQANVLQFDNDWPIYGVADYWATPEETLACGAGDCEDHAELKRVLAIRAGVPESELRLGLGQLIDRDVPEWHVNLRHTKNGVTRVAEVNQPELTPLRMRGDFRLTASFTKDSVWDPEGYRVPNLQLKPYMMMRARTIIRPCLVNTGNAQQPSSSPRL